MYTAVLVRSRSQLRHRHNKLCVGQHQGTYNSKCEAEGVLCYLCVVQTRVRSRHCILLHSQQHCSSIYKLQSQNMAPQDQSRTGNLYCCAKQDSLDV